MTKEQARNLWEAINDLEQKAFYAGFKMATPVSKVFKADQLAAWGRVKELLTKYTGHEVEW